MSGAEHKKPVDEQEEEEAGKKKGHGAEGAKEPLTKKAGKAWDKVGAPVLRYTGSAAKGVVGGAWGATGGVLWNEAKGVGREFGEAGARVGKRAKEGAEKVKEQKLVGKAGAGFALGNEVLTESLLLVPGAVARYALNTPGRIATKVGEAVDRVLYGVTGQYNKLKKDKKGGDEKPHGDGEEHHS